MLKKAMPLITLSGILLVGCGNNNAFPRTIETPVEDARGDVYQWRNDVDRNIEGRNFDNGLHRDGNIINERSTNRDDTNTQVEIIEDLNRKNNVH